MLGSKEERTKGIKRQAQELIEQAYERGYKAGKESEAIAIQDGIYQRGLDDAWEAAKKIHVMFYKDIEKIFGKPSEHYVYSELSASEAIAKIKAFEERKKAEEEIKVGDEVILNDGNRVCVIDIDNPDIWFFLYTGTIANVDKKYVKEKTGRHFSQIADVLKQLQEGEE